MERRGIYRTVDHTLLLQNAAWEEIYQVCDVVMAYGTASVCIPPPYVRRADEYLGDRVPACTVIGFPSGYNTTAVKMFEAEDVIKNGAAEIDTVINISDLRNKNYDKITNEIRQIKATCGKHILKMIIETYLLTDEEEVKMCQIMTKSGADYIKTSAGFSKAGATFEDIALFKEHIGEGVKTKAADDIFSFDDTERSIGLGAERLDTSWIVRLAKAEEEGHGRRAADTDGY